MIKQALLLIADLSWSCFASMAEKNNYSGWRGAMGECPPPPPLVFRLISGRASEKHECMQKWNCTRCIVFRNWKSALNVTTQNESAFCFFCYTGQTFLIEFLLYNESRSYAMVGSPATVIAWVIVKCEVHRPLPFWNLALVSSASFWAVSHYGKPYDGPVRRN